MNSKSKEAFFHQLSRQTASGITPLEALESLADKRGGAVRDAARRLLGEQGGLADRTRATPGMFSPMDAAMIEAGERGGSLPSALQLLADFHGKIAATRREIITRAIYPLVVLHLAIVLLALPAAFAARDAGVFFERVTTGLGIVYGIALIMWLAARLVGILAIRTPITDHLLFALPGISPLRQNWTAARFATVLSFQVRAGTGILSGMRAAGEASGSALLRGESEKIVGTVRAGNPLCEAFQHAGVFPEILEDAVRTGEQSGRMDEELLRASERLRESLSRSLDAFAEWLPRLLYFGVLGFTAWQILAAFSSYYSGVQSMFEDF